MPDERVTEKGQELPILATGGTGQVAPKRSPVSGLRSGGTSPITVIARKRESVFRASIADEVVGALRGGGEVRPALSIH